MAGGDNDIAIFSCNGMYAVRCSISDTKVPQHVMMRSYLSSAQPAHLYSHFILLLWRLATRHQQQQRYFFVRCFKATSYETHTSRHIDNDDGKSQESRDQMEVILLT